MAHSTASMSRQLLIVDDEEGIRFGLKRLFEKEGYSVLTAEGVAAGRRALRSRPIDVAVIDVRLKEGESGLELVREIKSTEPEAVIIVVTGYGSIDTAVAAMKEGAADYIAKPIDNIKLLDAVSKNLQLCSLRRENSYLRGELFNRERGALEFVTITRTVEQILAKANRIKDNPVTALIMGETGTGKEVLARYIHFTSNRAKASFVGVNCAALSESLMASELFGHEKGSFTGAVERRLGKFEIADGGTLFLDEIGDMPLDIQAKLLRVLEDNSFERVGGTRRISVDVRVLAATNKNLQDLIAEGKFREDLFYRINIVSFRLPPLRNRREDIPLLIEYFIKKYNRKYQKDVHGLSDELAAMLERYTWPGNVRELENLINQAVLLADGRVIEKDGFFKGLYVPMPDAPSVNLGEGSPVGVEEGQSLKDYLAAVVARTERAVIERLLFDNNCNKSKTARMLQVTRKTLARKIARYGIECNGEMAAPSKLFGRT